MCARPLARTTLLLSLPVLALGCGGDGDPSPAAPSIDCIEVHGSGQTEGHVRALVGSGVFFFDGVERPVHVGVYLNDMRDIEGDKKRLSIVYQFTWPNGDMMLTEDDVIFWPLLQEDRYELKADLTVKSGTGMFAGMEGRKVFGIDAELRFGPPPPDRNLGSVFEEFTAGGKVCPVDASG